MVVDSVRTNPHTQQHVVILKSEDQQTYLFIWIGSNEAYAIATELQQLVYLRPLTHDLLKKIIEGTGLAVSEICITSVQEDIFYAQIVLKRSEETLTFDARPSDALALAVRTQAPVRVAPSILESRGISQQQLDEQLRFTQAEKSPDEAP